MPQKTHHPVIELCVDQQAMARILGLFATGMGVAISGPCPLETFFGEVMGLDPGYVRDRLRTIFLNGQPVDDTARAVVTPGDVVALSAAMPGLVGICMRRDSPYKSFRGDITHGRAASRTHAADGDDAATLKLFNFIALEAGPGLLERGVILSGGLLARALDRGQGIRKASRDGQDCNAATLATQLGDAPEARFIVRISPPQAAD